MKNIPFVILVQNSMLDSPFSHPKEMRRRRERALKWKQTKLNHCHSGITGDRLDNLIWLLRSIWLMNDFWPSALVRLLSNVALWIILVFRKHTCIILGLFSFSCFRSERLCCRPIEVWWCYRTSVHRIASRGTHNRPAVLERIFNSDESIVCVCVCVVDVTLAHSHYLAHSVHER